MKKFVIVAFVLVLVAFCVWRLLFPTVKIELMLSTTYLVVALILFLIVGIFSLYYGKEDIDEANDDKAKHGSRRAEFGSFLRSRSHV